MVTHNLTLHYDRMMLILEPTPLARGLARQKVQGRSDVDVVLAARYRTPCGSHGIIADAG
jgi:hypothetical protein